MLVRTMGVTYNWVSKSLFLHYSHEQNQNMLKIITLRKKSSPSQLENFPRSFMPLKDYKNVGHNNGCGLHIGVSYNLFLKDFHFQL